MDKSNLGPMKIKNIFLCLLAFLALAVTAQPVQQTPEWEWYLDEVVDDVFVGRNYFEYYYTPSAADMRQQRDRGEVTFFLNSPAGLNVKKVRDMVDRLMASYDDIQAMNDWQTTSTTIWKEFRYEKNKFRFSIKRKALDDGTYYVSVTETAGYYKSLGKQEKQQDKQQDKQQAKQQEKQQEKQQPQASERTEASDKPTRRSARDRKPVVIANNDQEQTEQTEEAVMTDESPAEATAPALDEKERRRIAREREQAQEQEQRLAKRRAQEEQKAKEKALKEAEKQRKAEEKKQKEEEKRLKREEEKRQREQERQARQEEEQQRRQARRQADATKAAESHYHVDDIALWLSEKYDFTQIGGDGMSCTMYSNAVKDTDMAKLAVKNALKGSNARMAVPWRVNGTTGAVETGYIVDNHVLVFAIGKDSDDRITVTVSEVSQDQFEQFKQSINN